jgi:hypothetical protein
MQTATQFAWACCEAGDYPPPEPTRKNTPRYGPDDACWLCGGPTHGVGWPRKLGLADTFCDHNKAARMDSNTVCQACVATSASLGWEQYCRAHPDRGLWVHFPDKGGGKKPRAFNWLYTSHLFRPGFHESPVRARWRDLLTDPPEPPFLAILAISGKKQIVFRGRISYSRDALWVQADETRVLVRPTEFADCLSAFEALYDAGFSKDSIVSGQYHSGQLAKVGLADWRRLDLDIRPWRERHPGYLLLAHHCAQRTETAAEPDVPSARPEPPVILPPPPVLPTAPGDQLRLF